MGEIIHVKFGGEDKKAENPIPDDVELPRIVHHEFGGTSESLGGLPMVLEKVAKMRDFISMIPVSHTTYADSKRVVHGIPLSDVYSIIANSTENDWRTKPMYFRALLDQWSPDNLVGILTQMLGAFRKDGDKPSETDITDGE